MSLPRLPVGSFGATLPDPGEFEIVTSCAVIVAFVLWCVSVAVGNPPEVAQDHAFVGAMLGTALGIALYLTGLATGVY